MAYQFVPIEQSDTVNWELLIAQLPMRLIRRIAHLLGARPAFLFQPYKNTIKILKHTVTEIYQAYTFVIASANHRIIVVEKIFAFLLANIHIFVGVRSFNDLLTKLPDINLP